MSDNALVNGFGYTGPCAIESPRTLMGGVALIVFVAQTESSVFGFYLLQHVLCSFNSCWTKCAFILRASGI
eukprot:1356281-Amphidinium_carterae.1